MTSSIRIRLASLLALLILPALVGCRDDWQAATYPATGRLTINGQPAAGAVVQLVAEGPGPDARDSRPWAVVAADGGFALSTYEGEAGAPAGDYRLTISWPVDAAVLGSPDRLKGKYRDAATSTFAVKINAGPTAIPPIELTKVVVAANPRPSAAEKHFQPR